MNTKQEEEQLLKSLSPEKMPRHIAIIMDGNGRWAKQKYLPRIAGHRAGMESIRRVVKLCGELNIEALTLYAFSTENWSRPRTEVSALMSLLKEYLRREVAELKKQEVRMTFMGRLFEMAPDIRTALAEAEKETSNGQGLRLNIALNYSGRAELVDAFRCLATELIQGKIQPDSINEELISSHLYTASFPEPDLLIRTSGELRISNFLLWQIAYSEIWLTPIFWPDFNRIHLLQAIADYQKRERRFGGIGR
ncbi:MAG: isoprenyl transferase [bacterium]|nr:isoprenyl transferase [bacterium]